MRLPRISSDLLFVCLAVAFLTLTSLAHAADKNPLLNFSNAKGLQNKDEAWIAEKYELLASKINSNALVSESFTLTLPNGKEVTAKSKGLKEKAFENSKVKVMTSSGELLGGDAEDSFTVSVGNGPDGEAIHGILKVGDEEWILEQKPNSKPTLSRINHDSLPACNDVKHAHGDADFNGIASSAEQVAAAEGLTTIDVLLVYPPKTTSNAGGATSMATKMTNWANSTNVAYQNSQMDYQINIAAAVEVQDGSSTVSLESLLYELRNASDGYWDSAQSLREQYAADLVAMIAPAHDGSYCGIAYYMSSSVPYSVSALNCGWDTFAHELGHNMNFQHDLANASSTSGYNHGHRFYGNSGTQYRTIMSYRPGSRIQKFSNPSILHDGVATGVVGESNNAREGNENAAYIAGYRDNPTVCEARAAAVNVSPSSQTAVPGDSVTYTVNINNSDTAACLATTFNLSVAATGGISASLSSQSVQVSPGSSRNVTLTLSSTADAADGSFSAQVTVSDSSGTHADASDTAVIILDSTPPDPVQLSAQIAQSGKGKKKTPFVRLSWTSSSTADEYIVIRDGVELSATSGTSYDDKSVSAGSSYSYEVKAVRGSLESALSNTVTITVSSDSDGGGGGGGRGGGKGKNK